MINNAGFGTFGNFHELDLDTEDREVRLNVLAVVRLTHAAAGGMVERGRGAILNVASIAGYQPTPNDATYAATKAFVLSFTQAVHVELKGTGVSVSVLAPGFTKTEFQARASFDPKSVPSFLWQEAEPVARAGLDGLAKNRPVIVPGAMNRVAAGLSSVAPFAVTRRVAHLAVKRGVVRLTRDRCGTRCRIATGRRARRPRLRRRTSLRWSARRGAPGPPARRHAARAR